MNEENKKEQATVALPLALDELQEDDESLVNLTPEEAAALLKRREENFLKAHCVIDTSIMDTEVIIDFILGSINETNARS